MIAGLLPFISTCLVMEGTPGPNMGYLTMVSMKEGKRAGFSLVAGVATGLLGIGLLCMTSVGLLLGNSPAAYEILRWFGGAYLFYLAWEAWQGDGLGHPTNHAVQSHSMSRLFLRGLITNLLNPKAVIFYIAVLPEFITDPDNSYQQTLFLTLTYVVIATLVHLSLVMLAGNITQWLERQENRNWIRYGLVVALLVIALWFMWSTQRAPI